MADKGEGSSTGEVTAWFLAAMLALVPIQKVIFIQAMFDHLIWPFALFLIIYKPLHNEPLHEIAYQLWFFLCTRITGGVNIILIPSYDKV